MEISVAIIGRPNVGKSTLFNRLVGRRLALVDDTPGLTRDRRICPASIGDRSIQLIDTAGLEDAQDGTIEERMRRQSEEAIADAQIILFVIDARVGVTPVDKAFAAQVRASGKPIILLANKSEGRAGETGLFEAYELGLGEPLPISAEHGINIGDLQDQLRQAIDEIQKEADDADDAGLPEDERPLKIAILGRPNVGKSTLFNQLIDQERMITGPEAGLTRDSIFVDFDWNDRPIRLFDTAGLRRRSRISDRLEKLSVGDALNSAKFAEVVLLLMEPDRALEKQDLQIADMVVNEGRGLVICINKWDMVTNKSAVIRKLRDDISRLLPQISGIPVIPVSAKSGSGLDALFKAVTGIYELWNKRIPTGALNQFLREAVDQHPPPAVSGRRIRLRYMTQPNARPPTFIVFCSQPENLPDSYVRYLTNSLRSEFGLDGVPLRMQLRKGKNPYVQKQK